MWKRIRTMRLLSIFIVVFAGISIANAEIYVVRGKGGVLTFTSRNPGGDAKVFRLSSRGLSYSRGFNIRRREKIYPDRYNSIIHRAARKVGLEPALVKAVVHAESAFNPRAISAKGARGLMQLMPHTARRLGVRNAFSPEHNLDGGTRYLKSLLSRFSGKIDLALAAYNAGEGAVDRYRGVPPYSETRNYIRRVLELKSRYTPTQNG